MDAGRRVLLFTDLDSNTIYQVAADDEITVFRRPSHYSNGLAVDAEGRLLAAEAGARRVTRTESDGNVTPIAERFHGAPLNEPNDIVVRSDGTIYFTDPTFGMAAPELDFRGIFRIAPEAASPRSGAAISRRHQTAWRSRPTRTCSTSPTTPPTSVWVMDVAGRRHAVGGPDLRDHGRRPGRYGGRRCRQPVRSHRQRHQVFAPDGARWGIIPVPRIPANCAFGGTDGRTLFVTAREGLYRVTRANPGAY